MDYRMTGSLESAREGIAEKIARRSPAQDGLPADPWTGAADG
jgi:hypothetical protein